MKDYALFIPPAEVATTKARLWNSKQAQLYFNWFLSTKDDRVEYLFTSLDESLTKNLEEDIVRIGDKVTNLLFESPFSENEKDKVNLTNQGFALVADLSLLISKLIITKHPQLTWKIVKRPKSDISYNLPAMFDFPIYGHIELMGGAIMSAKAILQGMKTSSIWLETYRHVIGLID
jgi:hypothetical protein